MDKDIEYFQYLHSNPKLAESHDLYQEILSCLEAEESQAVESIQESLQNTDLLISSIEDSDQNLSTLQQNIQQILKKLKKKRLETKPLETAITTHKIVLPNMLKLIQCTKNKLKLK